MNLRPTLLSILILAFLLSVTANSVAMSMPQVSKATVHITNPAVLEGSIANVQLGSVANPSGDNYAPEETADAWDKTLAFLSNYV